MRHTARREHGAGCDEISCAWAYCKRHVLFYRDCQTQHGECGECVSPDPMAFLMEKSVRWRQPWRTRFLKPGHVA